MEVTIGKKEVYEAVYKVLKEKEEAAKKAMEEAQESANSEEKSSAGDKYETARAMSQNQRDMSQRQLLDVQEALLRLEKNERNGPFQKVFPGALIRVEGQTYFMGPGLGKISLANGKSVISLSVAAPLGTLFQGKSVGDIVEFQGKKYKIIGIE